MKPITRNIMSDAKELKFKDSTLKVYIKEDNGKWICQIFTGRKTKPTSYVRYRTLEAMETEIKRQIDLDIANTQYKEALKITRRENAKKLKAALISGATVRTSFSYNMTFNKFYRVVSNKGNTYKFEILGTDWVDGDMGWTGNVRAGSPTGNFIEGKITTSGLKIDNLYGDVIDPSDTFYENHMD
jgi:hypothetical protein